MIITVVPIISAKPVASSMPQNCVDLKMLGHTRNGFYLVKSNTKLQTVYCDLIQGKNEQYLFLFLLN